MSLLAESTKEDDGYGEDGSSGALPAALGDFEAIAAVLLAEIPDRKASTVLAYP
jgi:hypothetical protein